MTENSIGIDISKDYLDAHRLCDGAVARFANSGVGVADLGDWLRHRPAGGAGAGKPVLVVYEATGPWHRLLERGLADRVPLARVNPWQARRFAEGSGSRAKTDRIDAAMLARMGAAHGFVARRPPSEDANEMRELRTARQTLVASRIAETNRHGALSLALVRRLAEDRIAQIERQIARLDAEIQRRIDADPALARAHAILCSIPGIGAVTAAAILGHLPEIGQLDRKQVAALAGLAPMTRESGRWRGRATIVAGRRALRQALYMPALVASRHNPQLRATYRALTERGKPAKLALTCIMRKLIELANTLVKADRKWTPTPP